MTPVAGSSVPVAGRQEKIVSGFRSPEMHLRHRAAQISPGLLLSLSITAAAFGIERLEMGFFGHRLLDAVVIALLLGIALRTAWVPGPMWQGGIRFSGGLLLEVAVALLGASVSLQTILTSGPKMLAGVVATVIAAFAITFLVGRALGLSSTMSVLVASGNAICGNSAIAAVAPVIGAGARDVAGSIAFTAVLGVIVVLGLPLLIPMLRLSEAQYGTIAGLTVYAVPQVLAATLPVGLAAAQIATVVKMVRVLMLTPLLLLLASFRHRLTEEGGAPPRLALSRVLPWFILVFVVLATLRSAGLIPEPAVVSAVVIAKILTVVAMAALGLGVDLSEMRQVGARITACVTLSLAALTLISIAVTWLIGVR
jgi:uncharacterized integral membrane protein (TIGR00698 family)